jgi:hypothetical protein
MMTVRDWPFQDARQIAEYALLTYLMSGVASGAQISHSRLPTGWP